MAALMQNANSNLKEYFLDTKGACFVCLSNPGQGSIEKKPVRLRSLCMYLNISLPTALRGLEGHFGGSQDFGGGSQYEFLVTLCFNCRFIVKKLDDLQWDEEIARMELEDKVEKLHKLFEESEKGNDRWGKLRAKMNAGDPTKASLFEKLRNEMKQKCALNLQEAKATSFPKLLLDRIPPETSNETVALNKQKDTPVLVKSEQMDKLTTDLEDGGDKVTDKKCMDRHVWACSGMVNGTNCKLTFESKSALRKHEREFGHGIASKWRKEWICQRENGGCEQKFSNRFIFMRHKKKCCPERKSIVNQPSAEQLKRKQKRKRKPLGEERCQFCEGRFKSKKALKMHVQKVHQNTSTDRNEPSGEVDQDAVNLFQSLGMPLAVARYLSTQV